MNPFHHLIWWSITSFFTMRKSANELIICTMLFVAFPTSDSLCLSALGTFITTFVKMVLEKCAISENGEIDSGSPLIRVGRHESLLPGD